MCVVTIKFARNVPFFTIYFASIVKDNYHLYSKDYRIVFWLAGGN